MNTKTVVEANELKMDGMLLNQIAGMLLLPSWGVIYNQSCSCQSCSFTLVILHQITIDLNYKHKCACMFTKIRENMKNFLFLKERQIFRLLLNLN